MGIITTQEREYLLRKMKSKLDDYDYYWTTPALLSIIDTWAANNESLIKAFKKHPNYLEGKFMIAFDVDYDREINKKESYNFSQWLRYNVMIPMKENLPEEIKEKLENEIEEYENSKSEWLALQHNEVLPNALFNFLGYLSDYAERTISEETAKMLDGVAPNAHIHAGMKTSRAVNKLCTYLGYNKAEEYNKRYAAYADSLSPLKIKRHTILSINPLDYLTMSIGNSWTSCHSIETSGRERGCYSSGTISYMLDGTSMVFYTIDASYNGDEYFEEPKIVRQMFFYGEEKLIQSRLYPQSNDHNARESYDAYRAIVQKIMSEIFEFPNLWTLKRGFEAAGGYICSQGTHYRDYNSFDNCTLSRIQGSENGNYITVGHAPICIECGYEHDTSDNINCCRENGDGYYCTDCGEWVNADDVCWVGDDPYCNYCVHWCDCCESYVTGDVTYIEGEYRYVCEDCLDEYYVYCDECDNYVDREDARYIDEENVTVCSYCEEHYYATCQECGETYHIDHLTFEDGCYYCDTCYEELKENEDEEEVC